MTVGIRTLQEGERIATSSKRKILHSIFRKRKIPSVSWLLLSPKSLRFSGAPFTLLAMTESRREQAPALQW